MRQRRSMVGHFREMSRPSKGPVEKVRLYLKDRSYDILIGYDMIKGCASTLRKLDLGTDAVVISNKAILALHKNSLLRAFKKAGLAIRFELAPDSERAKSIEVFSRLISSISSYGKNRSIFIVAFGGGVIGDLSGFIASVYKRGIPYIQIPTTLLAQVDSAIGGKVALDLPHAKNLLGAFYQPRAVLSDISVLSSLSARQIKSGLAEIIKYGVIKDAKLFEYLERYNKRVLALDPSSMEYVISRAVAIKSVLVERDELDNKGERMILNFGHTIGHAIEAASGYSGRYNHGEAVAIGMVAAARISLKLGILKEPEAERIEGLIKCCGLPVTAVGLDPIRIFDAHLHDKKFARGSNRFVVPSHIGRVKAVRDVPANIIRSAIKECVSGQER